MELSKDTIIADLVSDNYQLAEVFNQFNIDYCCHGQRSLESAATEKKIVLDELLDALKGIEKVGEGNSIDFRTWPLDLLTDYVEKKHHRYVEKQVPVIKSILQKIVQVHGDKHPELGEVEDLFEIVGGEMTSHMKKEELMLFPYIKRLEASKNNGTPVKKASFGSVENPITTMMEEHDDQGENLRHIRELTNNYEVPADGCNTYSVALNLLQEFEKDLHQHIHIENNIMFPSAKKLEAQLKAS